MENLNEKKHIEEMAKVIASVPPIEFLIGSRMQGRHIYTATKIAEHLYNADYRKQSEDNVEVVRCKDCEYWNPMDNGISWHNKGRTDGECDMLYRVHCAERHLTEQDHFCSYAKMKGGAE